MNHHHHHHNVQNRMHSHTLQVTLQSFHANAACLHLPLLLIIKKCSFCWKNIQFTSKPATLLGVGSLVGGGGLGLEVESDIDYVMLTKTGRLSHLQTQSAFNTQASNSNTQISDST
jgi:hypothetical protein